MPDIVGTAYVRIRGVTTGMASDIQDGINKGIAGADTDVLEGRLTDSTRKAATAAGDEGGKTMSQRMREAFRKDWESGGRSFGARLRSSIRRHGTQAGDEGGKSLARRLTEIFQTEWTKGDGRRSRIFSNFFKRLSKFRLPGRFWLVALGIPALGGALKIAGSYIITLIGQLGYLVTAAAGAGLALAGIFGAVALAAIPLVLAFKAESEEMDAFKEGLEEQRELWMDVGRAVQASFLPLLEEAITRMGGLRGVFTDFGREVGSVFGEFAIDLADIFTGADAMERWPEVLDGAVGVFETLLEVVENLAEAFLPLMQAVLPISQQFVDSLARATQNFADFVTAGADSGALGATFQEWYERAESIGRSLWNLIQILWEIFEVGADVVSPQFENLEETTSRWLDKIRSPEGQDRLKAIFEAALPVAQEVNGLVGDIIKLIGEGITEPGGTEGIITFLQSLREDFLPAIATLAEVLAGELGDNLMTLATTAVEFTTTLAESGALGTFVGVLEDIIDILDQILQMDGIGDIAIQLFTFASAVSAVNFILGPLAGPLGKGLGALLDIILKVSARAVWSVLTALAGGLQAVFIALQLSLGLTPAILIIAGIVAAIAGLIWVFTHWDQVKEALAKAWEWIQEFFGNIWEAITDFVGEIPEMLGKVGEFFTGIWEAIVDFVGEIPGMLGRAGEALWQWIVDAVPKALEWIGNLWASVMTAIINFVIGIPGMMLGAATALWQWIMDAIPIVLEQLGYWIGAVIGFLIGLPIRIITFLVQASVALWQWIADAVPKAVEWLLKLWAKILAWINNTIVNIGRKSLEILQKFIQWAIEAPGKIAEWLGRVWDGIVNWFSTTLPRIVTEGAKMLKNFMQWVVDAAKQIPGKLGEFAAAIWNWIVGFVAELPDRFAGALDAALQFGKDIIGSIVDGLDAAIQTVWSWGTTFVNAIIDGIIDHIPTEFLKNQVRRLFGRGGNTGTGGNTNSPDPRADVVGATAFSTMSAAISPFTAQSAAWTPSPINTQSVAVVPTAQGGAINLLVKIGDQDITRIVDARVSDNDLALAHALNVRRR